MHIILIYINFLNKTFIIIFLQTQLDFTIVNFIFKNDILNFIVFFFYYNIIIKNWVCKYL